MSDAFEFPWYCYGSQEKRLYRQWYEFPARAKPTDKWTEADLAGLLGIAGQLSVICPAFLAHEYMSIRTKEGGLMPFNAWTPAQKKLYYHFMMTYAAGYQKPGRYIILKARQMGISTLCEFLVFWRCYFYPFSKGLIATHEDDASINLFSMLKLYYECIPGEVGTHFKWPTPFNNTERIVWDRPGAPMDQRIGSSVEIKTVALGGTSKDKQGKGRSQTVHILHASEVAFWMEPKKFWTGAAQTIPKTTHTHIFLESTANGMGGFFHDFWRRAARGWDVQYNQELGQIEWKRLDKSSTTGYRPCFFSWLEHPEYQAPIKDKRWVYRRHLDKREAQLVEHYGATLEQIQWRRLMVADECGGDEQQFDQEYPTVPNDAFITSGRRVFDMGALAKQEDRILGETAAQRGDYDLTRSGDRWQPEWREDPYGPVRVWKKPVPGAEYVMGVDACYGKADGDFACIQVLSKANWEQVAQVHGRLDGDQLAALVVALGTVYNEAKAVIEVDGPGLHALRVVQDMEYWNLYLRLAFDGVSKKPQRVYGWAMSSKARQLMVGELKTAVREHSLVLHDKETVQEMREWMLTSTTHGKAKEMPADPSHGYDDRITAIGIALAGGIIQDGVGGELAHFEREPAPNADVATNRSVILADKQWGAAIADTLDTHDYHPVLGTGW